MSEVPETLEAEETIEGFCRELHPHLEGIVHKYCDEAYGAIMENVQDYLRDNAVFNINSKFNTQHRAYLNAVHCIAAIESALTLNEAKANGYAFRKGYWTPEYAAKAHEEAAEQLARAREGNQP